MALLLALLLCLLLPNAAMAARQFNGSSDYLVSASNLTVSGSPKLTIAFWLWWDAYANDDAAALAVGDETGNGWLYIDPNRSNGTFGAFFQNSSPAATLTVAFTRPTAGFWHHYVFSIDRSLSGAAQVTGVWVDGATPAGLSIPSSDNLGASNWTNDVWYLMSFLGSSFFGAGRMDELVVYSGYNFVQADVDALYNRGLSADATTVQTPTYYWKIPGTTSPEPPTVGGINLTVHGAIQVTHPHPTVSGSTVTAASCSQDDVLTAFYAAFNGNTVVVPAGTCTWTTMISLSKAITLQGAGIDQTIIQDGRVRGGGETGGNLLSISIPAEPAIFRMTGFTWQTDGVQTTAGDGTILMSGCSVTTAQYRIDHNKFNQLNQRNHFIFFGSLFGVLDHNEVIANSSIVVNFSRLGAQSWALAGSCGGGPWGDRGWTDGITPGTIKAHYVEDNTITCNSTECTLMDPLQGARAVLRHNVHHGKPLQSGHGSDSGGRNRGYRWIEVYDNTFDYVAGYQVPQAMWARSGSGVFFNNAITCDPTIVGGCINHVVQHTNSRDGASFSPWGKCDGTAAFDGGGGTGGEPDQATGYRCLDQPGSSTSIDYLDADTPASTQANNTLEPVYVWNNTVNGSLDNCGKFSCSDDGHVHLNRDVYMGAAVAGDFGTARPGYTSFTYPHPLVTQTSPPTSNKHWIFRHRP